MNSFDRVIIVFGLVLFLTQIHAGEVILTDDDYTKLVGLWKGEHIAKGTGGGKVLFTNKVELVVTEQNVGEFTVKTSGNTWATPVEIQDGKVLLRFGNAERHFSYDEKGDEAILSVSYFSEGTGRKRQNNVVLIK